MIELLQMHILFPKLSLRIIYNYPSSNLIVGWIESYVNEYQLFNFVIFILLLFFISQHLRRELRGIINKKVDMSNWKLE